VLSAFFHLMRLCRLYVGNFLNTKKDYMATITVTSTSDTSEKIVVERDNGRNYHSLVS
jgi:hypothetical protein